MVKLSIRQMTGAACCGTLARLCLTTLSAVALIAVLAVLSNAVCGAFPALKPDFGYMRRYHPAAALIVFAVLPAVYEELVFRGLVLGFLRKRLPVWGAVLVSSFLFAALHWGIIQSAAAFVWGVFLSAVMIRTRSVYYCIYAHLLNNAAFFIWG